MTKEQKQDIRKVIVEALQYEWELRDNKVTVGTLIDSWVEKIVLIVGKRG
jgi:hypothetical protein